MVEFNSSCVNLFALDIPRVSTPGVPINRGHVRYIREFWFREPRPIPEKLAPTIVILKKPDAQSDYTAKLRRCSGDEAIAAFLEAFNAAIDDHSSPEVLQQWADAARKTPVSFVFFRSGKELDVLQRCIQERQDIKRAAESIERTTSQLVFEILVTRNLIESSTGGVEAKSITDWYDKIDMSNNDDKVSVNVVKSAQKLYEEVLSKKDLFLLVQKNESDFVGINHACKGVSKLLAILNRTVCEDEAKQINRRAFVFDTLHTMQITKTMDFSEFGKRELEGVKAKKTSVIEVFVLRQKLIEHLLRMVSPQALDKITKAVYLASSAFETYNYIIQPESVPSVDDVDMSFLSDANEMDAEISKSVLEVHRCTYDSTFRTALHTMQGCTWEEIMGQDKLKALTAKLNSLLATPTTRSPLTPQGRGVERTQAHSFAFFCLHIVLVHIKQVNFELNADQ